MNPQSSKAATYTAIALVAAGLVLVFLAWNGAAELDFTQGQIPYLISGGLTGVILAVAGLTLVRVQESRRDAKLLAAKLDAVIEALHEHATAASAVPAGPAHDRTANLNGHVVAGKSTYHLPTCRVVDGRLQDFRFVEPKQADQMGLSPCRICKPAYESAWAPQR